MTILWNWQYFLVHWWKLDKHKLNQVENNIVYVVLCDANSIDTIYRMLRFHNYIQTAFNMFIQEALQYFLVEPSGK